MTYRLPAHGWRGVFAEELPHDTAREWLAGCDAWFGDARVPLPAAPNNRALAAIRSPFGPAVAKRTTARRAQRAFDLGLALAGSSVPTALPIAALWPTPWRPRRRGVLICERIDAPTLQEVLADGLGVRLVDALARAVAQLHRRGFRHRDLKAPNLLVEDARRDPHVILVDLDGAAATRRLPSLRIRARDLARLRVSLEAAGAREGDWHRLLTTYTEDLDLGDELEVLEGSSGRWARDHAARNRRRGRPIA